MSPTRRLRALLPGVPARAARALALAGALAGALAASAPAALDAQYFGQNRVRYDRFSPRILRTATFDVHYDAPAEEMARQAARMAERWYARLVPAFGGHTFRDRKPLVFYSNHPDFAQTNIGGGGQISEGTRGFAEGARDRLVMPFASNLTETHHVLGHEIVHLMQFDVAERSPGGLGRAFQLPLWFVEGMAEYLSLGREDPNTALWLRGAVSRGALPTVRQLSTDPRLFPYRYGHAFWAYVGGRWGDDAVPVLYRAALVLGVEGAITRVLQTSAEDLTVAWHQTIRDTYGPGLARREAPDAVGRPILTHGGRDGLNLSPALSPDGTRVAFFTRRGLDGLDLVLGDAETGRILRSLGASVMDGHTDAVSFLYSSGAWSPDGRRFAYVVIREGDHQLAIVDARSGDLWRRVALPNVQSISAVAWSPDGGRLAVAGTRQGQPDLFVHDLGTRQTQQLTDDLYAELHPTWSPDGRYIAIATDDGTETELDDLAFGRLRLALVDPVGGRARLLAIPDAVRGARMSNPQWAPDGRSLYFVSDVGGVADVFRLRIASGEVDRLTRLTTGVSGITENSPAITVASETGRLLFTAFDGGAYRVLELDEGRLTQASVFADGGAAGGGWLDDGAPLGTLPPVLAEPGRVERYLADATTGLIGPTAENPTTRGYRASLALEGVGTPGIGLATGPFGTGVGGGVSLLYGDLLATRRLAVAAQVQGQIRDAGGQVLYLNQRTRWNWFTGLGRTPFVSVGSTVTTGTIRDGNRTVAADAVQQIVQRTFLDQAFVGAQYPFSRTRRVELSLTGTRLSQSLDVRETLLVGGRAVQQRDFRNMAGETFNYASTALAFVHDGSRFGPVGPIAGSRMRFEVGQTLGNFAYEQVIADARRYQPLGRLTFATRALHGGRYGRDSDDRRLAPFFLGEPQLVRGYQAGSFGNDECGASLTGACPAFDRLVGTRIAVTSVELRIPVWGVSGWSLLGGGLPIELAPFMDAGVAWTANERPRVDAGQLFARDPGLAPGLRTPAVSAGVAARLNLGPMILETFWARPFQRARNGVFGVQLAPAW